jgi:hypothetical protein
VTETVRLPLSTISLDEAGSPSPFDPIFEQVRLHCSSISGPTWLR